MGLAAAVLAASMSAEGARAEPSERLVMPFTCTMKNGRPSLQSAPPTPFEILGERHERTYTACREGAAPNCRSMMVHRFMVRCGGSKIAWARLAAELHTDKVGGSWFADGRLNLVMRPAREDSAAVSAGHDRSAAPRESASKGATERKIRFILPAGYAPVGEVGARLVLAGSHADGNAAETVVATASGPAIPEPATPENVTIEPVPDAEAIPALLDQRGVFDSWQTVVHTAEAAVPGNSGAGATGGLARAGSQRSVLWLMALLLAGSLGVAAVWFARQHRRVALGSPSTLRAAGTALDPMLARIPVPAVNPVLDKLAAAFSGVGASIRARCVALKWRWFTAEKPWQPRNTTIANGAQSAELLFTRAETAVRSLGPASVLGDTLTSELRLVRQRLDGLRGASTEVRTGRLAASLRGIVRDLERIGRIADSAAASLKTDRDNVVIPKTRSEAFEVLGLNPDTPETTLKRIVDALRMGWHPDHARDEADKALREDRTKQINIAWDLIVGKRQ